MKVTKIVTRAIMYDGEKGEQHNKIFIGRLSRRKIENITGKVCINADSVKAEITIPDAIVEQYAKIEPLNNEVKPAELV